MKNGQSASRRDQGCHAKSNSSLDSLVPAIRCLPWIMIVSLLGCSTVRQVKKLELRSLREQAQYVRQVDADLTASPNPDSQSTMSLFISAKTFNDALKLVDNTTIAIPQITGATVTVKSIRVNFQDGFPLLDCEAYGDKPSAKLHVSLRLLAQLQPILSADHRILTLKFLVEDVVPEAKWTIFKVRLWWFVRQLIRVKLQTLIDEKLHVEIPVRTSVDLAAQATQRSVTVKAGDGTVTGSLSLPAVGYHNEIFVSKLMTLHDGLRIYLKTGTTPK